MAVVEAAILDHEVNLGTGVIHDSETNEKQHGSLVHGAPILDYTPRFVQGGKKYFFFV
jgi:hypothetical protein